MPELTLGTIDRCREQERSWFVRLFGNSLSCACDDCAGTDDSDHEWATGDGAQSRPRGLQFLGGESVDDRLTVGTREHIVF